MSEGLKNSSKPTRGDFFRHGFIEDKVGGWLCARLNYPHSGWFELKNELKMLYMVHTSMGAGFKLEEPPARELQAVPVGPDKQLNGAKLRELAKELFEEMMTIGL